MRVAILLKKAEAAKFVLHEDVAFFIAKQVRSSVRELEGALNRIVAMAKFTGVTVGSGLAVQAPPASVQRAGRAAMSPDELLRGFVIPVGTRLEG